MSKLQELDNKYVANTYARFPVEIVSGKGSIAKDTDGKEYIDMGSGIGVTSFGIADDIWKQAVSASPTTSGNRRSSTSWTRCSTCPTCITRSPA